MDKKESHKPNSCSRFWVGVICEGFKKSREGYGLGIEVGSLVLAFAFLFIIWYSRHHQSFDIAKWEDFVNYWVAIVPLTIGAGWLLFHIFKMPHKIYKEQFDKINELELNLYQLINQKAPLLVQCQERKMPNGIQSNYNIILTNQNPTQGYDGTELKIKQISPPLAHLHEPNQSSDSIALTAIEFEPLDIKHGTIKGGTSATFPAFTVFEENDTAVFRFSGSLQSVHASLWNNFNQFSLTPNTDYILTFEATANGILPALKFFKLRVSGGVYAFEPII